MYLNPDRTSTSTMYSKRDTANTAPVVMMQQPRHLEGSGWRGLPSDFAIVTYTANSVDYCGLCNLHSHPPFTCLVLN